MPPGVARNHVPRSVVAHAIDNQYLEPVAWVVVRQDRVQQRADVLGLVAARYDNRDEGKSVSQRWVLDSWMPQHAGGVSRQGAHQFTRSPLGSCSPPRGHESVGLLPLRNAIIVA